MSSNDDGSRPEAPAPVKRHLPPPKPRITPDMLGEKTVVARFTRLKKLVALETWLMAILALALVGILPVAQPVTMYYARNPDGDVMRMTGMTMPNMTNQAILSWATTSITEVMTMGFGDMDVKVPKQRKFFTQAGWEAYVKSYRAQKIGEAFKQSQLVLTTVPSNTPVITYQGVNPDDIYQWNVQMPIVMTYATNGNVSLQKKSVVTLELVRVPVEENAGGIAIENWVMR